MKTEPTNCKEAACNAKIVFLTKKATFNSPEEKVMPIDFYPSEDGNVLVDLEKGTYQIVKKSELEKARRLKLVLHKPHWASCKRSEKFRRKK